MTHKVTCVGLLGEVPSIPPITLHKISVAGILK